MRILSISRWCPCPPDNGSKARIYNLLKHLSRRHEITLAAFTEGPVSSEALSQLQSFCQSVQLVPFRQFEPGSWRALLGFFSSRPRSIVDSYSPEMEMLVRQASASQAFDAVAAFEVDCAPYTLVVKDTPRVLEDLEVGVLREQYALQRRLLARVRFQLTWLKLSRYLSRLLRDFQGVTVVSQRERDLAAGLMPEHVRVAIVPNGVDLEANSGFFGAPNPDTLIYTGALTYAANLDAMEFFVRDIMPLIQAQRPSVTIKMTGRYDGVPSERLPVGPGVTLTGYLDDIRPAIAQSWACVVPLRIGAGTRLKILEALALGTPVVSTRKGAEGLDLVDGEHILIADEPADFAAAVLRLLDDPQLRDRLATSGRQLVQMRYGWDHSASQLEQLLLAAVQEYRESRHRDAGGGGVQ
jgi:glycosyltransferase involved in cell wall biosynthesis